MTDETAIAETLRELADEIEGDETPDGWESQPCESLDEDWGPYKKVGRHAFVDLYVDSDGDLWAANEDDSAAFIPRELRSMDEARSEARGLFPDQ